MLLIILIKRENLALVKLREQREREMEILKLEKTKCQKDNENRSKNLDIWEKEINSKLKEYRKLECEFWLKALTRSIWELQYSPPLISRLLVPFFNRKILNS